MGLLCASTSFHRDPELAIKITNTFNASSSFDANYLFKCNFRITNIRVFCCCVSLIKKTALELFEHWHFVQQIYGMSLNRAQNCLRIAKFMSFVMFSDEIESANKAAKYFSTVDCELFPL